MAPNTKYRPEGGGADLLGDDEPSGYLPGRNTARILDPLH